MKINEKLKALRIEQGLSQQELAKQLKIGQTTVAAYENGARAPQIYSLIAYADYFKCSLDYIVGREDDFGNLTVLQVEELTADEKKLLASYRLLDGNTKRTLCEIARVLVNSDKNDK